MNRMISRAFAAVLPVLHLVVLGLLATAAFTDIADLPGEGARETFIGLALAAGYLLFAGVTSTLVRIADAAERISAVPAPTKVTPMSITAAPEPATARSRPERREPMLVAVRGRPDHTS